MASRWPQCAVRFYERFKRQQTIRKKEQNDPNPKHRINVHTTTDFTYVHQTLKRNSYFLPLNCPKLKTVKTATEVSPVVCVCLHCLGRLLRRPAEVLAVLVRGAAEEEAGGGGG